jgi:hypothetical protein
MYIGSFSTEEQAARKYDELVIKAFGFKVRDIILN